MLYNGKSIGDVLDLTFEEAAEFFRANPRIHRPLALLVETGLGYLKLGQPSPTLSGGEAQRLKLVTELTRGLGVAETSRIRRQRTPKSTLYLLEEPTIGLHMADVHDLLKVLHRLVDDGNTVVVIEHNISLIADADYVIDIGPEAGEAGGNVVAAGTPEQVAKSKSQPHRSIPARRPARRLSRSRSEGNWRRVDRGVIWILTLAYGSKNRPLIGNGRSADWFRYVRIAASPACDSFSNHAAYGRPTPA